MDTRFNKNVVLLELTAYFLIFTQRYNIFQKDKYSPLFYIDFFYLSIVYLTVYITTIDNIIDYFTCKICINEYFHI